MKLLLLNFRYNNIMRKLTQGLQVPNQYGLSLEINLLVFWDHWVPSLLFVPMCLCNWLCLVVWNCVLTTFQTQQVYQNASALSFKTYNPLSSVIKSYTLIFFRSSLVLRIKPTNLKAKFGLDLIKLWSNSILIFKYLVWSETTVALFWWVLFVSKSISFMIYSPWMMFLMTLYQIRFRVWFSPLLLPNNTKIAFITLTKMCSPFVLKINSPSL